MTILYKLYTSPGEKCQCFGQPAGSQCAASNGLGAVNLSTTTKYYKRQELFFPDRCYKSLTVLFPHLREHPFPKPFTLQRASPGAPQPEAVGSTGRLGEEEFSSQLQLTPACWHPGTKSLHRRDQPGTPVIDTVIKRSKHNVITDRKLWTSWSFSFSTQQISLV